MNKIIVVDGYIVATASTPNGADANADRIEQILQHQPSAPTGYVYKLRADNLEWDLVELPPAPEDEPTIEDKAEAYDILMGEEDTE